MAHAYLKVLPAAPIKTFVICAIIMGEDGNNTDPFGVVRARSTDEALVKLGVSEEADPNDFDFPNEARKRWARLPGADFYALIEVDEFSEAEAK